jgi:hypothetical protein
MELKPGFYAKGLLHRENRHYVVVSQPGGGKLLTRRYED